jgi:branched-chain amino acid transport system ATP-binding protein
MLTVTGLNVHYGPIHAVRGVDLSVEAGSVTALLGANGAGKTTTLMAIAGARKISSGRIVFEGEDIAGRAVEDNVRAGIAVVPEGRRVFASLSVEENLRLAGSLTGDAAAAAERRERMMEQFPILAERRAQKAGLLSGGEQQMLAVARALMSAPKLLLLDEPSLGLAPLMVNRVFDIIEDLKETGIAILLVEQNVPMSLEVAERAVVLTNGRISASGTAAELAGSDLVRRGYMAA